MVSKPASDTSRGYERQMTSEFQYSILFVLAEGSDYGLGIKKALQDYYGEEINHGRLYPNLNELFDDGYLRKSTIDSRTNEYELTERGLALALDRLEWAIEKLIIEEDTAKALIKQLDEAVLTP